MRAAFLLLALTAPVRAAPTCALDGRAFLEGRALGTRGVARAVDARLGEKVEVFVAAPGRIDGRPVIFGESGAPGRTSFAGCGPVSGAWRRVEPRMEHTATRAPNAHLSIYANAVVFGPSHGRWIGFDRIEYFETALPAQGPRLEVADAAPTEPAAGREGRWAQLGAMRLAATVRLGDVSAATPGAEDAPDGQISPRVFRYTFRADDTFLGWLGSFLNVPYLFGSAGKGARSQAERYVGADCADVLVAAYRRAGRLDLAYSSVEGLTRTLLRVAGPVRVGAPDAPRTSLRVGVDVVAGDLLALDYVHADELPRAFDHIVAFVEDRGPGGQPDGVLGPEDLVVDSGDKEALKLAPLERQGEVIVTVLRPPARRR